MQVISLGVFLLAGFYTISYMRASGFALVPALIITAALTLAGLLAARFRLRLQMPRWVCVIIFFASLLLLTTVGVAAYEPAYLLSHPFSVQFNTVLHVVRLALFYGAYTCTAFLLGDYVLTVLRFERALPAYALIAIGVGLMAGALYFYVLSLLHLMYPLALVPLVGIAVVNKKVWHAFPEFFSRIRVWFGERLPLWSYEALCFGALSVLLALYVVQNGWPVVLEGDSLAQYYDLPKTIAEQHALVRYPFWTFNDSVIAYAFLYVPLVYAGSSIFNFAAAYFFLLGLPLLIALGRRLAPGREYIAVWLYSSIPMFASWLLLTPKIDHLVIYFVMLAAHLLVVFRSKPSLLAMGAAGAAAGFAVALKFNTILTALAIAALGLYVIWHASRGRRSLRILCIGVCAALFMFGVFAARTWYYHGNPLYPFSGITNYRIHSSVSFSPADEAFLDAFIKESDAINANFGFSHTLVANIGTFFHDALRHASFNYGVLLMLVLAGFFLLKSYDPLLRIIVLSSGGVMLLWYVFIRTEMHYIDALTPFFALMGAYVLVAVRRWTRGVILVYGGALLVLNLTVSPLLAAASIGGAHERQYFSNFPSYILYPALETLIRQNPDATILSAVNTVIVMPDTFRHRFMNVRNYVLASILARTDTAEEARQALREIGITHLIYSPILEVQYAEKCEQRNHPCPLYQEFFANINDIVRDLEAVAQGGSLTVYEL